MKYIVVFRTPFSSFHSVFIEFHFNPYFIKTFSIVDLQKFQEQKSHKKLKYN